MQDRPRMIGDFLLKRIARGARRAGNAARDARRWDEAAAAYRRYLALKPEDAAIAVQLGHVLTEAGDSSEADAAYRVAARLAPDDADLELCWGHSRLAAGDADGAIAHYRRSVSIDGNDHARAAIERLARQADAPADPAAVGVIESCTGPHVTGFVRLAGGGDTAEVEFAVGDRIVGTAVADRRRGDGDEVEFDLNLAVHGLERVVARRLPDGAELLNSPFECSGPERSAFGIENDETPMAWDAAYQVVKPFVMAKGQEVALFVTHSGTGALRPHVAPYLAALDEEGIAVLLIAVVDRQLDLPAAVLDCVAGAIVRANAGYDFAAWAHALHLHPEAYGASILYLLNDSVVGPPDQERFARLIGRVRASDGDLIGLTDSHEYRWHLQSYFLALKPRLLSSLTLHGFFGDVRLLADKDEVIRRYELAFAELMTRAGHEVRLLFPSRAPVNPTLFAWRALLAEGFPFVKLLMLRGTFPEVDLTGWRDTLARAGFDVPLIDVTIAATETSVPIDKAAPPIAHARLLAPPPGKPLKIAFYGPWNYDNGLGAASRGTIAALRRSGVRLNLHPIKQPFHVHRPLAPPVDVVEFAGPADIAIIHLNPDSWFLLTPEQRAEIARAYRRIGYWVWEMGHLPEAWWSEFGAVDRIWAPSRYCASLFERQDGAPVDVIPHAVPLPVPAPLDRAGRLAALGIAPERRVILFIFDGSSYLIRKNPAALVRAFAASGLGERGWSLLLKTKHLMDRPEEGEGLSALVAATPHARLIDRALPSAEMAGLFALADIYASPHSSEGFGLTIAEAMAAGKAVVATDFGGSRDFLDAGSGYPVAAEAQRLDRDFGHYTRGGEWAVIDEGALATALVAAAAAIEAGDGKIGRAARARIADRLSYAAVGALIADSLAATVATPPAIPPVRPLRLELDAWHPVETAQASPSVEIVPLAADGSVSVSPPSPGAAEWLLLAPVGACIAPDWAERLAEPLRSRRDVAIFYADDVASDTDQPIDQVRLKPDFDRVLLAAQDYIGAPLIVRASALAMLGGLQAERGTAATADLLFRAHAAGLSIARIPEVLLAYPGRRVRATPDDYRRMLTAQPALASHDVLPGRTATSFALARRFGELPPVTLLIPTRQTLLPSGDGSYVGQLLAALATTEWPMDRLHIIVGDDGPSSGWATGDWPFHLTRLPTPREPDQPFNYAAKMNRLWRAAETEQLVFLNDDVLPTGPGWLKALLTFSMDDGVGGVGARLLYEDGRLQHAGMARHGASVAHLWLGRRRAEGTYQDWALCQREWSMVTGAVFATRRACLEQVDGFDERFSLEYNDVDLCLRLRMLGYAIVYTPEAELIHAEKASRGEALPPGDQIAAFLARWSAFLERDPAFHPGVDHHRLDMAPRRPDDFLFR